MATLPKVLTNRADYQIGGGVALRLRTQAGRHVIDRLATAYNNRGVAYRLKAEYDKAIEDFNEAIRLRPTFQTRISAIRNLLGFSD